MSQHCRAQATGDALAPRAGLAGVAILAVLFGIVVATLVVFSAPKPYLQHAHAHTARLMRQAAQLPLVRLSHPCIMVATRSSAENHELRAANHMELDLLLWNRGLERGDAWALGSETCALSSGLRASSGLDVCRL